MTSVPSTTIHALTTLKSKSLLHTSLFSCGLAHTFVTSNYTLYLDSPKLKISNMKFFTSSHIKPLYQAAFLILDNDTTIHAWNLGVIAFSLLHSSEIPTDAIFSLNISLDSCLSLDPCHCHYSDTSPPGPFQQLPEYLPAVINSHPFSPFSSSLHVTFRAIFLSCRYHYFDLTFTALHQPGSPYLISYLWLSTSKGLQNP